MALYIDCPPRPPTPPKPQKTRQSPKRLDKHPKDYTLKIGIKSTIITINYIEFPSEIRVFPSKIHVFRRGPAVAGPLKMHCAVGRRGG